MPCSAQFRQSAVWLSRRRYATSPVSWAARTVTTAARYDVKILDPVPLHVEQASKIEGVTLHTGHMLPGGPFPDGYFHDPAEIAAEFAEAGLHDAVPHGLEGAAWLMGDTAAYLDDPERRRYMLDALRAVEIAPSLLGASGHILT